MNRRAFLGAAGGLLLRFHLPGRGLPAGIPAARLNAFVLVGSDDVVTLFIPKAEMGQGTVTSLAMLLAEELECDWRKIRTEFPGVDPAYGGTQGVGGSRSVRSCHYSLRQAGAAAREMLVRAAAHRWGVEATACRAENGCVTNTATGAQMTYGSLAEDAAKLRAPIDLPLKPSPEYKILGKPMKRLDTPGKVDGSTGFGIDVRLPGMLYAVVERCPVFGGTAGKCDDARAKAAPGVKTIVRISNGIAVIADSTWAAMEGRRNLAIEWNEGPLAALSTADITRAFAAAVKRWNPRPGLPLMGIDKVLATVPKRLDEVVYQVPYLAHAPMEPLNCTAWVKADSVEVWASTQAQSSAREIAARKSGLPPEKVQVHTEYMGGSFGRRGVVDYIGEAVEVAKSVDVPVKLTWSREDDIQHDRYRPAAYCRCIGGLDADGWPAAWKVTLASTRFGDSESVTEGFNLYRGLRFDLPLSGYTYLHENVDPGIPVGCWRSRGYSQNTFFAESYLDEMAHAGGKDPIELRRRLIPHNPRLRHVLDLAAERAEWGKPLPAGRGRGVAMLNSNDTCTVQIAEVSVESGTLKVHRVTCVVDCGAVVNPTGVAEQIRSGIAYGLSALKGGITIKNGRVEQSNFHDYEVLRIDEMPAVDVHIVPSTDSPGGVGEAGTPGIAPAVCNAIFAATGKRIRRLPIRAGDLG